MISGLRTSWRSRESVAATRQRSRQKSPRFSFAKAPSRALFDARLALIVVVLVWAGRRLTAIRPRGGARGIALLSIPGLLLVAGTVFYTAAADEGQLSIVSVLGSLFPVFTVGLSMVILRERLSAVQSVGVVAALSGIVLIAA